MVVLLLPVVDVYYNTKDAYYCDHWSNTCQLLSVEEDKSMIATDNAVCKLNSLQTQSVTYLRMNYARAYDLVMFFLMNHHWMIYVLRAYNAFKEGITIKHT